MHRARRCGFVALLALVVGCHLAGGLTDLEYTDPSTTTLTGSTTSSTTSTGAAGGTATGAGGGGGAGNGGTGGDGAAPVAPCHDTDVEDGFSGTALDGSLWDTWQGAGNMTFGVDGGRAYVQPPANLTGDHYGDFFPYDFHDMTGCATWAKIETITNQAAPAATYVGLWHGSGNEAVFDIYDGTLHLEVETDGNSVAADSLTYSATEHRWVRFRHEPGTLYLETSPDGLVWTWRLSATTPWWITSVRIYLGAGTWDAAADPGRGEFDYVNLLP